MFKHLRKLFRVIGSYNIPAYPFDFESIAWINYCSVEGICPEADVYLEEFVFAHIQPFEGWIAEDVFNGAVWKSHFCDEVSDL